MMVFVLGMHKSGTTLISQICHESGFFMGDFDKNKDYDHGNKYEDNIPLSLNKRILKNGQEESIDIVTPISSHEVPQCYKDEIREYINATNQEFPNWGFKDPRAVLAFDLWSEILKEETVEYRVLAVFRSPVEVWRHYAGRVKWRKLLNRVRVGVNALYAWAVYNEEILRCLASDSQPNKLIDYSTFMGSERILDEMSDFLGVELKDMRNKVFYRASNHETLEYTFVKFLVYLLHGKLIDSIHSQLQVYVNK